MKKPRKYLQIINQCYEKNDNEKAFSTISERELKINLELIDKCIDCVADELCDFGFDNDEPNEYGLELEETISYLLEFRYKIVNASETQERNLKEL